MPKIGVDEFLAVAERFGFNPEAMNRLRAAVTIDGMDLTGCDTRAAGDIAGVSYEVVECSIEDGVHYLEANEMVQKIEKELEERFRNYRFEAEREKNRNRLDKAKNIYRQLMLTFPNQDDPRYLYAKELFDEIAE